MIYKALIAIVVAMCIAGIANAIVIVPPIIYFVTFSIGTFILNIFIMTAVYIASRGLINRFYFGRHMHEIVGILFSYLGYILTIISTSFISIAIFDPIDAKSLFYASIFSTFLSFLVMALNNFRRYVLSDRGRRNDVIISMLVFSVIVFVITFVSAYFSISTSVIKKGDTFERTADGDAQNSGPELNFGMNSASEKRNIGYYDEKVSSQSRPITESSLWFSPYRDGLCEIYAMNKLIKAEKVLDRCFFYDINMNSKRIACPIGIDIKDVNSLNLTTSGEVKFEGKGACLDSYSVHVTENGFINIK